MNCETCQILITEAAYEGEDLSANLAFNAHFQSCPQCKEYKQELEETIATLKSEGLDTRGYEDIPQRAELDSLWTQLQPALDKIDAERFRQQSKTSYGKAIGGVIALAACLVLFVGIIREPVTTNSSPVVAENAVNPEVMSYLNRAQIMLLQVANSSAPQAMDIPMSQDYARDMAMEASFLNTSENNSVNASQKKLLKDIEFLLTQIANLDESNAAMGVDLLQRFLEEKNILFKIRLLELRERQNLI